MVPIRDVFHSHWALPGKTAPQGKVPKTSACSQGRGTAFEQSISTPNHLDIFGEDHRLVEVQSRAFGREVASSRTEKK